MFYVEFCISLMKNKSKPIRKCPAKQKNKFLKKKYLVFQIHENEKRFTQSIKEKKFKEKSVYNAMH